MWLSRKAKARTRKAQARIDEAGRMQSELADLDRRSQKSVVGIDFAATERRTKQLIVAKQRQGPTCTIPLVFFKPTTFFAEMERRRDAS